MLFKVGEFVELVVQCSIRQSDVTQIDGVVVMEIDVSDPLCDRVPTHVGMNVHHRLSLKLDGSVSAYHFAFDAEFKVLVNNRVFIDMRSPIPAYEPTQLQVS